MPLFIFLYWFSKENSFGASQISWYKFKIRRFKISCVIWWKSYLRSKSRIKLGLLWAAELKATRATRRTFKSGSVRALKKSPMLVFKRASIGWKIKEKIYIVLWPKPLMRRVRTSSCHLLAEKKSYPWYMVHLIFFLGIKLWSR